MGLAIGMMASTFAYFTDVETSTGNTFTAGTMGLQIWDDGSWDPDDWGHGVDRTWEMFNMQPGASQVTNFVMVRETGSATGDHIEIAFTDSITPSNLQPQDMARWLEVTQLQYTYINLKDAITSVAGWDVNHNGFLDLDDIVRSVPINAVAGPLDNLPAPHIVGNMASLHMTVKFNSGAINNIQGAALTLEVAFNLEQVASQ
jgi:spore coat-associated protein N